MSSHQAKTASRERCARASPAWRAVLRAPDDCESSSRRRSDALVSIQATWPTSKRGSQSVGPLTERLIESPSSSGSSTAMHAPPMLTFSTRTYRSHPADACVASAWSRTVRLRCARNDAAPRTLPFSLREATLIVNNIIVERTHTRQARSSRRPSRHWLFRGRRGYDAARSLSIVICCTRALCRERGPMRKPERNSGDDAR
jgi:hypothetical protein